MTTVEGQLAYAFQRLAVRDHQALLARLEDEANDLLIGAPGVPGNSRRAGYVDRWRLTFQHGLSGPFDARLGPIAPRKTVVVDG